MVIVVVVAVVAAGRPHEAAGRGGRAVRVLGHHVAVREVQGVEGAAEAVVSLHLLDVLLAAHPLPLPLAVQEHPVAGRRNLTRKYFKFYWTEPRTKYEPKGH